ncbi:hypothetical protein SUGI_0369790 [Cryptomeria japonica]|nr:hypothetical protein SUGI_0369790 [Cryptomeria japonica]
MAAYEINLLGRNICPSAGHVRPLNEKERGHTDLILQIAAQSKKIQSQQPGDRDHVELKEYTKPKQIGQGRKKFTGNMAGISGSLKAEQFMFYNANRLCVLKAPSDACFKP